MKESPETIEAREQARRTREIAKIHLAKKQLGLDEATYRATLKRVAGCLSSAELTAGGRALVLEELRALGFKPAPARGAGRRMPEATGPQGPQIRMIRALVGVAGYGRVARSARAGACAFLSTNHRHCGS